MREVCGLSNTLSVGCALVIVIPKINIIKLVLSVQWIIFSLVYSNISVELKFDVSSLVLHGK